MLRVIVNRPTFPRVEKDHASGEGMRQPAIIKKRDTLRRDKRYALSATTSRAYGGKLFWWKRTRVFSEGDAAPTKTKACSILPIRSVSLY